MPSSSKARSASSKVPRKFVNKSGTSVPKKRRIKASTCPSGLVSALNGSTSLMPSSSGLNTSKSSPVPVNPDIRSRTPPSISMFSLSTRPGKKAREIASLYSLLSKPVVNSSNTDVKTLTPKETPKSVPKDPNTSVSPMLSIASGNPTRLSTMLSIPTSASNARSAKFCANPAVTRPASFNALVNSPRAASAVSLNASSISSSASVLSWNTPVAARV